jgi:hypothetical protein
LPPTLKISRPLLKKTLKTITHNPVKNLPQRHPNTGLGMNALNITKINIPPRRTILRSNGIHRQFNIPIIRLQRGLIPTPPPQLVANTNLPRQGQKLMKQILMLNIRQEIHPTVAQPNLKIDYLYKLNYILIIIEDIYPKPDKPNL